MDTEFNESSGQQGQPATAPEFLADNEADYQQIRKPPKRLKKGWMLVEATRRENKLAKTGTLSVRAWCSPVDESGEVSKAGSAPLDIYIPVANPGFINPKTGKEHERPNTVFGCYMTALAVESDFPRYPKKLRPGVYEDQRNGTLIDEGQKRKVTDEIDQLVVRTSKAWYNDKMALVGKRFYAYIDEELSETDGKTYSKVTKTRATAPADEQVLTSDFFVTDEQ